LPNHVSEKIINLAYKCWICYKATIFGKFESAITCWNQCWGSPLDIYYLIEIILVIHHLSCMVLHVLSLIFKLFSKWRIALELVLGCYGIKLLYLIWSFKIMVFENSWGIFHRNCLKIAPIQSKVDFANLRSLLVHLIVRSCS
jgi:hypothetical protein